MGVKFGSGCYEIILQFNNTRLSTSPIVSHIITGF